MALMKMKGAGLKRSDISITDTAVAGAIAAGAAAAILVAGLGTKERLEQRRARRMKR